MGSSMVFMLVGMELKCVAPGHFNQDARAQVNQHASHRKLQELGEAGRDSEAKSRDGKSKDQ